MYVLAQRVLSPIDKNGGVNTFLHMHESQTPPRWDDIDYIADLLPGRLISEHVEVRPGGNRVLSFLEAAGADTTDGDSLTAALDACETQLAESPVSTVHLGGVTVRFSLARSTTYTRHVLQKEFQLLRAGLQALLSSPHSRSREPFTLTVWQESDDKGFVLYFDAESQNLLQTAVATKVLMTRLSVSYDVQGAAPQLEHLLAALLGAPPSQLPGLARVDIKRRDTGATVMTWEAL